MGCERLRQDLRRRHVSAGVVLGLNKQSSSGLVRPQTTLNSAVPLWGSDPLAQEIEGLLDSASSNVNDSVLIRSQSVPLHQMLHQFQSQGVIFTQNPLFHVQFSLFSYYFIKELIYIITNLI